MNEHLKDHVAVVTGAGSGIGRAIALALASSGAVVCLVGRRRDRLTEVGGAIVDRGAQARTYVADLTSDSQVRSLVEAICRDHREIDVLVHSAGVFTRGAIGTVPIGDLDTQFQTNMRAPYLLTAHLLPLFRRERGEVVFVNSTVGRSGAGGVAAYSSMKHGLRALADALREEVNWRGIRVLSVFIGRTATPMQQEIHRLEGKSYRPHRLLQPDDVASIVVHALSLPRTAEVTDITIRPLVKPEDAR